MQSIKVDGREYHLKFNLGTLRHMAEVLGTDPLSSFTDSNNPAKFFDFVFAIVYGGIKSNRPTHEPTKDQIAQAVEDLSLEESQQFIKWFSEAFQGPKIDGEGEQHTQHGQTADME